MMSKVQKQIKSEKNRFNINDKIGGKLIQVKGVICVFFSAVNSEVCLGTTQTDYA